MKGKILYILALLFAALQTFAQTTYTYDDLNRLTSVTYSNGVTVSYTYDALGNRTSKKVTGASAPKEAYAWLSSDGKTLTFCYDDQRAQRNGNTYDLNTEYGNPEWNPDPWNSPCEATSVVFESSFAQARPQSTYSWFHNFENLTEIIGIKYLNTSEVTNMYSMFRDCKQLKTLDLSHFNTSKVSMLWAMFDGCSSLESLDLSSFDTSKVTDMTCLFSFCYNLKSINVSSFDTSKVTNMYMMFEGCHSLTSLDVSKFNTSKVTIMSYMFDGCNGLTSLDLSNFDTSNLTSSQYLIDGCNSLKDLCISSTMENISEDACRGVGSYSSPCTITAPEDFDFGVETTGNYFYWKSGCFRFWYSKEAYAWLSSDKKTLTFCNDNNRNERVGETYSLNSGERWGAPDWNPSPWENPLGVTSVVINPSFADVRPTSTCLWFGHFNNLSNITGLKYLNTSEVTIMSCMFDACSSLTSLDLSHFDTSNVTDFSAMFRDCNGLTTINLSSFNTAKAKNMEYMFANCYNLSSLNVNSFDVSNVRYMESMFNSCISLTSLDLHNFNLPSNGYTYDLLCGCNGLNSLKISSSMSILSNDACSGVGTTSNPCTITAPEGFDFGVDTSGNYFVWKEGIFKLGSNSGLLGDVNHDGFINISDVTSVISYILNKAPSPFFTSEADVNGDGFINISDVTAIINIILNTSAAHIPANARHATIDHLYVGKTGNGYDLCLDNTTGYTACEMTLQLPDGCRLTKAHLTGECSKEHHVLTSHLGDGLYRVVVYSDDNNMLCNGESTLIHLTVEGPLGDDITLTSIVFVDGQNECVVFPDVMGVTAISGVTTDSDDTPTYNLQGVPMHDNARGVHVRKGGKYVKKIAPSVEE